ncbi:hypothetical protein AVEN_165633-1 [Araneus ventricosus]|uniref:Uncharacterized protein n=1 Tax=Araneus ventricosus TaxID=182803 RepID=A0A4Y2IIK4_ARAVE|nr:hypothetical protein AVEN_165633-1 [Araneus ventricosus]
MMNDADYIATMMDEKNLDETRRGRFINGIMKMKHEANVSDNVSLQQQIAQLKERLRHAKMLSQERLRDITSLRQSFDHVLQTSGIHNRGSSARQNPSVYLGRGTLWQQQQHVVPYSGAASTRKERDFDETLDLQLPSLHHYLPHLLNNFDGLQPAVKIAGSRTGGNIRLISNSLTFLLLMVLIANRGRTQ